MPTGPVIEHRGRGVSEAWCLRGPARLVGTLQPMGDKSIAHRALLIAALARGGSLLRSVPDADDVLRTVVLLRALGVEIESHAGTVQVRGVGLEGLVSPRHPLDCGNSGTTLRLLAGLLAAQPFSSRLVGDDSLTQRPMNRVVEPLRTMGARIECEGANGRPPLLLHGVPRGRLQGRVHRLDVDSAQVRSALLLAGLRAGGPTRIVPAGASRDHMERLLESRGVRLRRTTKDLVLWPAGSWSGFDLRLPGDLSSAAFFVCMAAATPGARLHVRRVGLNPGRARYLQVLQDAGAQIEIVEAGQEAGEPWGDIRVRGGRLRGFSLAGQDTVSCIDEIPALLVAAAAAGCPAEVRDASELRVKESDRITGLARILKAFGARVDERDDGLRLCTPVRLQPAHIRVQGDHRLVMASSLLALRVEGPSRIENVGCVRVSYPGFAADLTRLTRPGGRVVSGF